MRPYHIEVSWIDYDTTNNDDVYEVRVYDNKKLHVISHWSTIGRSLGNSISVYMGNSQSMLS